MVYGVTWSDRFRLKKDTWVYVQNSESRKLGEQTVELLEKKWKCPDYFFHLKSGGHVIASKVHMHANFFCCIDIESFFNSISRSRVTRSLKKIIPYDHARRIAKESTVKNHITDTHSHHIPFGYTQSPILASICLNDSSLGAILSKCYRQKGVRVSVYMDDIIISSNNVDYLTAWFDLVSKAAIKSGFSINNKKTQPPSNQIEVFNLYLSNKSLLITPERMDLFREQYLKGNDACKEGIERYIASINNVQSI